MRDTAGTQPATGSPGVPTLDHRVYVSAHPVPTRWSAGNPGDYRVVHELDPGGNPVCGVKANRRTGGIRLPCPVCAGATDVGTFWDGHPPTVAPGRWMSGSDITATPTEWLPIRKVRPKRPEKAFDD